MIRKLIGRLLSRSLVHPHGRPCRKANLSPRLVLLPLEDRCVPATYEWMGGVDDSYWNGANWSPLALPNGPGPADDVVFDSVSAPTCRIGLAPNNQPYKVNSLLMEGVDFLSNPTVKVDVPNFEVTSRLEIQAGTLGMSLSDPPLQNVASVVTVPDGGRFLWSGGTISGITLKLNVTPHQLEMNYGDQPHLISGDALKTLTSGAKILATGALIEWQGTGDVRALLGSATTMPEIHLDAKDVQVFPDDPNSQFTETSKLYITGSGSMTNDGGQAVLNDGEGGEVWKTAGGETRIRWDFRNSGLFVVDQGMTVFLSGACLQSASATAITRLQGGTLIATDQNGYQVQSGWFAGDGTFNGLLVNGVDGGGPGGPNAGAPPSYVRGGWWTDEDQDHRFEVLRIYGTYLQKQSGVLHVDLQPAGEPSRVWIYAAGDETDPDDGWAILPASNGQLEVELIGDFSRVTRGARATFLIAENGIAGQFTQAILATWIASAIDSLEYGAVAQKGGNSYDLVSIGPLA